MTKSNSIQDCTTIRTRDREVAWGITRKLDSWARSRNIEGRVAKLDGNTLCVSEAVPRAVLTRVTAPYRRVKIAYAS